MLHRPADGVLCGGHQHRDHPWILPAISKSRHSSLPHSKQTRPNNLLDSFCILCLWKWLHLSPKVPTMEDMGTALSQYNTEHHARAFQGLAPPPARPLPVVFRAQLSMKAKIP